MSIKTKAIALFERQLTKQALVLETRAWNGRAFFEVDLHLPDADFSANNGVQHIKCRVAPLTFRDYTIAKWDDSTKTCTLFVDAGHQGAGSTWVKTLEKSDHLSYMNIETHRCAIAPSSNILFLGDQSAVGHFLALQQLAGEGATISGAVAITDAVHCEQLQYFYPELTMNILPLQGTSAQHLTNWLMGHPLMVYDLIYIAGNSNMVAEVRRYLKKADVPGNRIKAQGFWQ